MKQVIALTDSVDPRLLTDGVRLTRARSKSLVAMNEATLDLEQYGESGGPAPEKLTVYDPVAKIHWVFKGKGTVKIRGRIFTLHAGFCYLLGPHELTLENPGGFEKAYARFHLRYRGVDLLRGVEVLEGPFTDLAPGELLRADLFRVKSIIYDALSPFYPQIEEGIEQAGRLSKYAGFHDHARTHLGDKDVLRHACSLYGVSLKHFSEGYKKDVGITPKAQLTLIRIEKAKDLLVSTSRSIDQIAEALGYLDRSHFSKSFKKTTGTAPGEFRRRYGVA